MTIVQLLNVASKGYPDGLSYFYDRRGNVRHESEAGGSLALFVVSDIASTFSEDSPKWGSVDQLNYAISMMESAQKDLEAVISSLTERRQKEENRLHRKEKRAREAS